MSPNFLSDNPYQSLSSKQSPAQPRARSYRDLRILATLFKILGLLAWIGGFFGACIISTEASSSPGVTFLLWFGISFIAGLANLLTAELIKLALDAKADLEQLVAKISILAPTPNPAEAAPAADDAAPPASPQA